MANGGLFLCFFQMTRVFAHPSPVRFPLLSSKPIKRGMTGMSTGVIWWIAANWGLSSLNGGQDGRLGGLTRPKSWPISPVKNRRKTERRERNVFQTTTNQCDSH